MDLQEQGRVNQNLQGQLDMKDKRIQELEQKNLESPLMETQNAKQIIQEIRAHRSTCHEGRENSRLGVTPHGKKNQPGTKVLQEFNGTAK